MYKAIDVAKYIILYCKKNSYSISNLKLQKLLYYVQAQFLFTLGRPAFEEEIVAWNFGPVVPVVYRAFRVYGNSEIPSSIAKGADKKIYSSDQVLIDNILKQCAPYTSSYLVAKTHAQDPWKNAYIRGCNNIITNDSIKKYFEGKNVRTGMGRERRA